MKYKDDNTYFSSKKEKNLGRKKLILISIAVLILMTALSGTTLAFLMDRTGEKANTFTPSRVACEVDKYLSSDARSDIAVENTGDTEAYIRAAVIITWKDDAGIVYGSDKPEEGNDYTIIYCENNGWFKGSDGYYYYSRPVSPKDKTAVLIEDFRPLGGTHPDGYSLSVEIVASSIQSTPIYVVEEAWQTIEADAMGNLINKSN